MGSCLLGARATVSVGEQPGNLLKFQNDVAHLQEAERSKTALSAAFLWGAGGACASC